MTSDRPLLIVSWPTVPTKPGGGSPVRALGSAELIDRVGAALAGGPTLAIIPSGPAARRRLLLGALGPRHPIESAEIGFVVATSGTTGVPKGVLLTAAAVTHSARATHDALGGPGQWLLALPPTQIAGLQVLVRSAVAGITPEVMDLTGGFTAAGFAAAAARLDGSARRYTALVPTQLARLLAAGETGLTALAGFDAVLVGGAAAPAPLLAAVRAHGVRVVSTYGMTETAGGCVYDGHPLPTAQVDIGPDHRIRVRGPMLASGYRLRPDLTAARFRDGWFLTSDFGVVQADGRLRVLGRTDDVINTGGVKVSAAAVMALLEEHPQVRIAAAFGVPDDQWGERVVAVVIPRDPDRPPGLAELRAWVGDRAAPAMAPAELHVVDELPTFPSGKLDIAAVAARIRGHAADSGDSGDSGEE